jgi:hypothetical protein
MGPIKITPPALIFVFLRGSNSVSSSGSFSIKLVSPNKKRKIDNIIKIKPKNPNIPDPEIYGKKSIIPALTSPDKNPKNKKPIPRNKQTIDKI